MTVDPPLSRIEAALARAEAALARRTAPASGVAADKLRAALADLDNIIARLEAGEAR